MAMASSLPQQLAGKLLSFPVTPFTPDHRSVDLDTFQEHLRLQLAHHPGALFVACGTGEFPVLGLDEYATVVAAAVELAHPAIPVVAGAGYAAPLARQFLAAAADAGADGALLLPPYLLKMPQAGLYDHVAMVASESPLPLIVYQRDNAIFEAATAARIAALPQVIGLKDGVGDLERLTRIALAVPKNFLLLNGMPTAEIQAIPYTSIGVTTYSSAALAFAPEVALRFYAALHTSEQMVLERLLADFYRPLVELRNTVPGYAVSLVKAGARYRGLDVGGVRPPLSDPTPEHRDRLYRIIDQGLKAVAELPPANR